MLVYLGNVVFDVIVGGIYNSVTVTTATQIATELTRQINTANWAGMTPVPPVTLTAVASGTGFTVTASGGADGNSVELLELHKTGTAYLTPAGASKLNGGVDPTSIHVHVDFTGLSIDSLRQCWLTFAPAVTTDSGGANPAVVAYQATEWSAVFSNWTLADPNVVLPLKVAGPGSILVSTLDRWAQFLGSGWALQPGAIYQEGFSRISSHATDSVTVLYSCQHTHDLYLGTELGGNHGIFSVTLDSVAQADLDTYLGVSAPIQTRRVLAAGVAAGQHTLQLAVKSSHNGSSTGYNCTFDFLQACVKSDVPDPVQAYPAVNTAWDFDTMAYQLPPERLFWLSQKQGFRGDLNLYAGVFYALKRVRYGGHFHTATITIAGPLGTGTGFGDGDAYFVDIGGTTLGVAAYPADTVTTLAQRFVNAINAFFMTVSAAPTTAGVFTITTLSPNYGFTVSKSASGGSTGSIALTGDLAVGNEGTWQVDATQASPLNRAYADYLADLAGIIQAASQTMVVAFSQELLGPPDANTSGGAWVQRFANGSTVLTATGFGSWGAGLVEALAVGVYQQTGHGYVIGNTGHFASGGGSGQWVLVVTDSDHYTLGTQIANSGGYTPGVGDSVFIDLQTSQCTFNPATVTAYLTNCYKQAAGILATAGLVPWLQFGEVGWWFDPRVQNLAVAGFSNSSGVVKVQTAAAHGLSSGQNAILAGTRIADGTLVATVIDSTHFTVPTAWPGGTPPAAGTVSGGGMAYYDAYTAAQAVAGLSRPLASFWTPDDNPAANLSDVALLSLLLVTHVNAIIAAVLAVQPGSKFEVLLPLDVNAAVCYYTADVPDPQGGRLNHAVNVPGAWLTKAGSNLDRMKVEGLSWAATYRNFEQARATVQLPYTVGTWSKADTRYLVPFFNGGCDWVREYLFCLSEGITAVNFWAVDHGKDKAQVLPA
jgi:hypothetical protein